MSDATPFDALELVLIHRPGVPVAAELICLQALLEPDFSVSVAYESEPSKDPPHQLVRISSVAGRTFETASAIERIVRELAGSGFNLYPIGAVRRVGA